MSSIMDALKRIEREEQERQELPPFDLPPEAPFGPPRGRRQLWIAVAGVVLVAAAGSAVWITRQSQRDETPAVEGTTEETVADAEQALAPAAVANAPVPAALPGAESGQPMADGAPATGPSPAGVPGQEPMVVAAAEVQPSPGDAAAGGATGNGVPPSATAAPSPPPSPPASPLASAPSPTAAGTGPSPRLPRGAADEAAPAVLSGVPTDAAAPQPRRTAHARRRTAEAPHEDDLGDEPVAAAAGEEIERSRREMSAGEMPGARIADREMIAPREAAVTERAIAGEEGTGLPDAVERGRLRQELIERRQAVMARRAATATAAGTDMAAGAEEGTADALRPWQRPFATTPPPEAEAAPGPVASPRLAAAPGSSPGRRDYEDYGDETGYGENLAASEADARLARPDTPPPSDTLAALPRGADLPELPGARLPPPPSIDDTAGPIPAPAAETPESAVPPEGSAAKPEEAVSRRPPRGAPRVSVSFLFYSDDPGRRRVMLTVNEGTELITLYEGQTHESFEVAHILPDEVHLRYQGQLFAVQPRY